MESNMALPTPTSLRTRNGGRNRQRLVPMPTVTLTSVASIFVIAMLFPKTTLCWTASTLATKKTKSTTYGWCPIDDSNPSCNKRSIDAEFSPSSPIALWSTKSDADTKINSHGGSSINGNNFDTANQKISYGTNSTENIFLVETEREDKGSRSAELQVGTPTNGLPLTTSTVPTSTSAIDEIAIVLNTNAKGVTEDLIEVARDVVAQYQASERQSANFTNLRIRLLVTSTYEEARLASREILDAAAYTTTPIPTTLVIPVGGDGTLTAMINLLWEESVAAEKQRISFSCLENNGSTTTSSNSNRSEIDKKTEFPFVFGYVAMGTGNALGSVVGCMPVAEGSRKRHRKRKKISRFLRKCLRPGHTAREDFRQVLSQLIQTAAQTNRGEHIYAYGNGIDQEGAIRSESLEVDSLELPLIRVRTTRAITTPKHGILSENGSTSEQDNNQQSDRYAFFAGLGYDSLLLQDYKDLQDWTQSKTRTERHPWWQVATTGVAGYTVAMITRSLPKLLKLKDASRLLRDVKITTDDPHSTYWIDHRRGDTMRPAAINLENTENQTKRNLEESPLYRGSAGIVAAGTVPYYGGGLRLFPFARMTPDGMHLRIARRLHPFRGISRIPWIFEGSFRDKSQDAFRCLDFVGNQFTVEIYESFNFNRDTSESSSGRNEIEEGFPVQHSGETLGRCTRVEFTVSTSEAIKSNTSTDNSGPAVGDGDDPMPPPVRFLTLMPPRIAEEKNDMGS